jgi:diguanylate cyclase (GGDEF)-like protein
MSGRAQPHAHENEGLEAVDRLNDGARALVGRDLRRALSGAEEALAAARGTGYALGEARALRTIGDSRYRLADGDGARASLTRAIELFSASGDLAGEADARITLGRVEYTVAEYDSALSQFAHALALGRQGGDRLLESNALNGCAAAHFALGEYRLAAELYLATLELKRVLGDRQTESGTLNNLGLVYQELGDYEAAATLHRESLAIKRGLDDRQGEANALANLGVDLQRLGRVEEARSLHEQALALAREIGNRETEAACLENLGTAAAALGDGRLALSLVSQALTVQESLGSRLGAASALVELGRIRTSLGDIDGALHDLDEALRIAEEIGARRTTIVARSALADVCEQAGEYRAALTHSRAAADAEQALTRDHLGRPTAALLAGFEVETALRGAEIERLRSVELAELNGRLERAIEEKEQLLEQLSHREVELERSARTDSLTGLANRRWLEQELERRFREARRYGRELALAFCDLDNFRLVNDRARTHRAGDEVLRQVASLLGTVAREVDVVARWAGDEFAILFPQTSREAATNACERMRLAVEQADWSAVHGGLQVTISIGIAGSGEASTPDELVFLADERLYEAKEDGRNQVSS